ncbi:phospholipase A2, partial [Caerostris extrusa]
VHNDPYNLLKVTVIEAHKITKGWVRDLVDRKLGSEKVSLVDLVLNEESTVTVKFNEVPVIGIIGSGGGFRAMTALSGAMKALADTKVLDCANIYCRFIWICLVSINSLFTS